MKPIQTSTPKRPVPAPPKESKAEEALRIALRQSAKSHAAKVAEALGVYPA